ncbi:MAG: hypothetical protein U9N85_13010 [Bacteroidota bacterium]|nr:hypothetical protein [Bacteroidota bacterium]
MTDTGTLRFVNHKAIDFEKWNRLIASSVNGRIFAYSWYLNIVAPGWDALIRGDYDLVVPLPRKKIPVKQFVVPPYTNQLSLYSRKRIEQQEFETVFKKIREYAFLGKIESDFEYKNTIPGYRTSKKYVYQIDMVDSYENIKKNYSPKLMNRLSELKKEKYSFVTSMSMLKIRDFANRQGNTLSKKSKGIFKLLVVSLLRKNLLVSVGMFDRHNALVSCALLVKGHNEFNLIYFEAIDGIHRETATLGSIDFILRKFNASRATMIIPENELAQKELLILKSLPGIRKAYPVFRKKMLFC